MRKRSNACEVWSSAVLPRWWDLLGRNTEETNDRDPMGDCGRREASADASCCRYDVGLYSMGGRGRQRAVSTGAFSLPQIIFHKVLDNRGGRAIIILQFNTALEGVVPQRMLRRRFVSTRGFPPGRLETRDSCSGYGLRMGRFVCSPVRTAPCRPRIPRETTRSK